MINSTLIRKLLIIFCLAIGTLIIVIGIVNHYWIDYILGVLDYFAAYSSYKGFFNRKYN